MSDYDKSIHSNPSAKEWTKFFLGVTKNMTIDSFRDESYMITWFANAMMAVHDHLYQKEIDKLKTEKAKLEFENKKLHEKVSRYSKVIQYTYDTCLCERFTTYGFDYHEKHPNRDKNNGGSRPFTPKINIENMIGFEWKYEKPEGVCNSWKELTFGKKKEEKEKPEEKIEEKEEHAQENAETCAYK